MQILGRVAPREDLLLFEIRRAQRHVRCRHCEAGHTIRPGVMSNGAALCLSKITRYGSLRSQDD